MPKNARIQILDTAQDSQVITPHESRGRTIYDAPMSEVFWKSLVAGFALGIGRTVSSLIFYVVVFGLLLSFFGPIVQQMLEPINRLVPLLESGATQQQNFQNQVRNLFQFSPQEPTPQPSERLVQ